METGDRILDRKKKEIEQRLNHKTDNQSGNVNIEKVINTDTTAFKDWSA